ncbi:hypothetical protein O6H91_17G048900 [Diphasiastrum complanatum]|uniref:Uncharacterized protein n=1 Tax=Diphasiastrum complanatum TaxID=34168 RepID=A0ACC2B6Q1_DIPCM|nr:hypothetical protein O6H91_17G048900 [Diphasiastrum complanatum]
MFLDQRNLVRLALFFFLVFLFTGLLLLLTMPRCGIIPSIPWQFKYAFPRCSMESCFNFSRCDSSPELLVYSYNSPQPIKPTPTYLHNFPSSLWHTSDPQKACLFFYYSDSQANKEAWIKPELSSILPFWNNGLNHVIITFADKWSDSNPPQHSIGMASILGTLLQTTTYRPEFDISIPLPRLNLGAPPRLTSLEPFERKYFLTFKGRRYFSGQGEFRSSVAFKGMHNGVDVIVVTTCKQGTNDKILRQQPWRGAECNKDQTLFESYDYVELLNSTFGLAPAGRSPASYRMLEVLSAGTIPILIGDNYVRPFNTLIQWQDCLLQFPISEIHRILPTLRALPRGDVEARQKYCRQVFDKFLKDDNTLVNSIIQSLKDRFMGTLSNFATQHTK